MGNSIGGKRRRARVMTVDGTTYKYRAPAAAGDALREHPGKGNHLLESEEVRRLGLRARPLDPDAPLKPGKLYFLVELPPPSSAAHHHRRARAPQRTWSGALHYGAGAGAGAGERLESLMLARRSASDVAASSVLDGGALRLRLRLPKADVQRLVDDSRDAADAAERIMQLCVARDQQRRHRSAPATPLAVPVAAPAVVSVTSTSSSRKDGYGGSNKPAPATGKKEMNPCFLLGNPEQTPLARGARVGVAHRRREETWRLPVRPLEAVLRGPCAAVYGKLRRSRRLDAVQSGCTALSIVKHGDLMVVANVDDSRVVLGTATYDDAITPSSSSST